MTIKLTPAGDFLAAAAKSSDWGPWRLKPSTLVLDLTIDGYWRYEVDLERCLDSASTLDWIHQVAGKRYADDDAVLAGLVRAIDDVLKPQANLCSFRQPRKITKAKVAELVERAAARWPHLLVG